MESVYQLNDRASITDLYEAMASRIDKVHALIALALEEQLLNNLCGHQQHYFWVLSDLMAEIRELSGTLLQLIEHQRE